MQRARRDARHRHPAQRAEQHGHAGGGGHSLAGQIADASAGCPRPAVRSASYQSPPISALVRGGQMAARPGPAPRDRLLGSSREPRHEGSTASCSSTASRCSVCARCRWRRSESRDSRTARSLRRNSLTSRRTAHIDAVQPSGSSTGSPIMCSVRISSVGPDDAELAVDGPPVDQAARHHRGEQSPGPRGTRRTGSSSSGSGPAPGGRPKIWYSSSDQLTSSLRRFHSALPTRLSIESRGVGGRRGRRGASPRDSPGTSGPPALS